MCEECYKIEEIIKQELNKFYEKTVEPLKKELKIAEQNHHIEWEKFIAFRDEMTKKCEERTNVDVIGSKRVEDRTSEEHQFLIKNKYDGDVREYLLSMGKFKEGLNE